MNDAIDQILTFLRQFRVHFKRLPDFYEKNTSRAETQYIAAAGRSRRIIDGADKFDQLMFCTETRIRFLLNELRRAPIVSRYNMQSTFC